LTASGAFDPGMVRVIAVDTATGRRFAVAMRGPHNDAGAVHARVPVARAIPTHCSVGYVPVDVDGALVDLADAAWIGSQG
jgi:hypothetical protein